MFHISYTNLHSGGSSTEEVDTFFDVMKYLEEFKREARNFIITIVPVVPESMEDI